MKSKLEKFVTQIGLEVHFQLKAKCKLFSPAPNTFNAQPNSGADSYDWGYPGTLPRLNLETVKLAVQTVFLLHGSLASQIDFDRKNYYYFDLPRGYQITQFHNPLGRKGYLDVLLPSKRQKRIYFNSIHLEEDSAKVIHQQKHNLVDYNRAGIPLVEVVTTPIFESYEEVEGFIVDLIWYLQTAGISNAKFEEGSIRVDVNISQKRNNQTSCPLTEIKNLNSFKNIKLAIQQETVWQIKKFATLKKACTKTFDEKNNTLLLKREKFSQYDYFFMRENNIAPIQLDKKQVDAWIQEVVHLLDFRLKITSCFPSLVFSKVNFFLENSSAIFYFLVLMNELANDEVTVFLFLKEIFWPHFYKDFTTGSDSISSSEHKCNFTFIKRIFASLSCCWKSPFLVVSNQQVWKDKLKQKLLLFWKKNSSKKNLLNSFFWNKVLSQSLLIDLELLIVLLKMYQKKQINFKVVKSIFLDFYFHQIIYSNAMKTTLLQFVSAEDDALISVLVVDLLQKKVKKNPDLVVKYQNSSQNTTNYLMGAIRKELLHFSKEKIDSSRIDFKNVTKIIQQFFLDLKKKQD